MKVPLSRPAVFQLVRRIASDFDLGKNDIGFPYIQIMKDLLVADQNRDRYGNLVLTRDTVYYIFYLFEEYMMGSIDHTSDYTQLQLSASVKEALRQEMEK